jgi:ABC-type multidrug transport system fused ATPase/permease subunit
LRQRRWVLTTQRDTTHPVAPNALHREFTATEPHTKWVADITYIPTTQGWLYLAVMLDLYSRAVVGWSMSDCYDEELAEKALNMAVARTFRYELDELYTKRRNKEITEEDFSVQRDALLAQEAKSHEAIGPLLVVKELEGIEAEVVNTVNQRFQKEVEEENARTTREQLAKIAKQKRIAREEYERQKAIENENRQKIIERNKFRTSIDEYSERQEWNTNRWQRWCNWLQILLIVITTATASMAGFSDIPRGYVVGVGFTAASLGGILSYFQLQDKIYGSRKALASLRLECQKYDYCLDDYQDRRTNPEAAYLRFSKKVTEIQAEYMLYEVELLNPRKQEKTVTATKQASQMEQKEEDRQTAEEKQTDEMKHSDGTKEIAAKGE